jgi:hypothetical protein
MSIQSLSFYQQDQNYWTQSQSLYQQDQNYWSQAQAQSQASSADASLINVIGTAETNEAKGLASIANDTALKRVNSQISALVQQALQSSSSNSSSPSSSSSSSSASSASTSSNSAASASPTPATGIGTIPLTQTTTLASLGIPPGGTIAVSDGTNTTTYTSTGSDTVADLIGAINSNAPETAYVTASLNQAGHLVITGKNTTESVTVAGTFAPDVGFGVTNQTFQPKAATAATTSSATTTGAASTSAASASTGSSTASSTSTSSKKTTALPSYLANSEQGVTSAASILTADGVSGTLVDLLA